MGLSAVVVLASLSVSRLMSLPEMNDKLLQILGNLTMAKRVPVYVDRKALLEDATQLFERCGYF